MTTPAKGTLALLAGAFLLAGCVGGGGGGGLFGGGSGAPEGEAPAAEGEEARPATSVRLVDRDVEAPEVFQVTDQALWDGRPSLGGVWVASPDATDPERVIMRNPANGKFVIGALFRRERDNPGPALQISSDAAEALGLLAGQPARVSVTALRREEAPVEPPDATKPILDAAEAVATAPLDPAPQPGRSDPAAVATAALDRAAAAPAAGPQVPTVPPAAAAAAPAPAAPPAPAAGAAAGRIQIGIFSVEANAKRAVDTLAKAGVTATIRPETTQGKAFWNVTAAGDGAALAKVKSAGFKDAYLIRRK
jgi:hypothetical protein